MSLLHYCDTRYTAVLYSDCLLPMGHMEPKMTLGTLTMTLWMTFQAFEGPSYLCFQGYKKRKMGKSRHNGNFNCRWCSHCGGRWLFFFWFKYTLSCFHQRCSHNRNYGRSFPSFDCWHCCRGGWRGWGHRQQHRGWQKELF